MESKTLLTGILSFIAGALLVSIAATTFDKPKDNSDSMSSMIEVLKDKSGDKFDEEFISQMIVHHEGAVEMAKLAEKQAKHDEIKQLSKDIISAQEKEINDMKQWQASWGYTNTSANHNSH
jgi:uncharacterized protein (DUF305 family)